MSKTHITVEVLVHSDLHKCWENFTSADRVIHWNFASPEWHCPVASSDLKPGGKFAYTMAARDGSESFDLEGVFDLVQAPRKIAYILADGRKVEVSFEESANGILVRERFEAENMNPLELQKAGWQAILDNFRKYTESH